MQVHHDITIKFFQLNAEISEDYGDPDRGVGSGRLRVWVWFCAVLHQLKTVGLVVLSAP